MEGGPKETTLLAAAAGDGMDKTTGPEEDVDGVGLTVADPIGTVAAKDDTEVAMGVLPLDVVPELLEMADTVGGTEIVGTKIDCGNSMSESESISKKSVSVSTHPSDQWK
jgi:hypothetical protein